MHDNDTDWQELLAYALCDIREASRDPQQGTLDVQRLQCLREAVAAIEAAEQKIRSCQ